MAQHPALGNVIRVALCLTGLIIAVLALRSPGQLAGARPLAAGETYAVTSTADEIDANLGDGICNAAGGGCTLRAAVMQANFTPGVQTITVPAGTYLLSPVGVEDSTAGDIDVNSEVVIIGAGSQATVIDGNGATTGDRVFFVNQNANLRLSGLTVRNGQAPTGAPKGGGMLCQGPNASIVLDDVIVEQNRAESGGGIYHKLCTLTMTRSIVRDNAAGQGATSGEGGGITTFIGTLSLDRSSVISNSAGMGGGLILYGAIDARITRSEFLSNTASDGGGIVNNPTQLTGSALILLDTVIRANHAFTTGGGIVNTASISLTRTVIEGNVAGFQGGGLMIHSLDDGRSLAIADSTFGGNRAQEGGGIAIDAISLAGTAPLDIVGSTFEGNIAARNGGAIFTRNGAVINIVNSTIDGNSAGREGGGLNAGANDRIWLSSVTLTDNRIALPPFPIGTFRGGGLFITSTAAVTINRVILAGNIRDNGITPQVVPDDCFVWPTTSLRSTGYNVVQTTTNCIMSGTTAGSVHGQDPQLMPLANYGGWTKTRFPILPGTLSHFDPNLCRDHRGNLLLTDQRSAQRTQPAVCSIGAVHVGFDPQPTAVIPSSVPARPEFTLEIAGERFLPNAVALWSGAPLATAYFSSTRLALTVPSNLVTRTGTFQVQVYHGVLTNTPSLPRDVVVTKALQTITFGTILPRTLGDGPFQLAAAASSVLPLTVQTSGSCQVSNGTVSLTGGGTCTIVVSQPGDEIYDPAAPVTQTFAIAATGPTSTPAPGTPTAIPRRIYLPSAATNLPSGW